MTRAGWREVGGRPTLGGLVVAQWLLALIRFYQRYLSPLMGGQCRFYPSCSRYAYACIEGQGAARGALLSVVRVCKCHPLHPGGFDPPPDPVLPAPPPGGVSPAPPLPGAHGPRRSTPQDPGTGAWP